MGCDCRCQKDEEEAEGPVLGHEDGAVQEGEPNHGDRNDLDLLLMPGLENFEHYFASM